MGQQMKAYYITGVPGNGKSTIARMLAKNNISSIDIDENELCKWVNKESKEIAHWQPGVNKEFFELHDYYCDADKLFSLVAEKESPVFVLGLADNQKDFLDRFDKIFLFKCSPQIFFQRINTRTNNDFGKHKEEQDMISGWYEDFEKEMLDLGAIPIDTSSPIEIVYNKLISHTLE